MSGDMRFLHTMNASAVLDSYEFPHSKEGIFFSFCGSRRLNIKILKVTLHFTGFPGFLII